MPLLGGFQLQPLGSFRIPFVPQQLKETDPTPLHGCGKRSPLAHSTAPAARPSGSAPGGAPGRLGRRAGGGARPVTQGSTHQSECPAAPAERLALKKELLAVPVTFHPPVAYLPLDSPATAHCPRPPAKFNRSP